MVKSLTYSVVIKVLSQASEGVSHLVCIGKKVCKLATVETEWKKMIPGHRVFHILIVELCLPVSIIKCLQKNNL